MGTAYTAIPYRSSIGAGAWAHYPIAARPSPGQRLDARPGRRVRCRGMAWRGAAGQGLARQGVARLGMARQGHHETAEAPSRGFGRFLFRRAGRGWYLGMAPAFKPRGRNPGARLEPEQLISPALTSSEKVATRHMSSGRTTRYGAPVATASTSYVRSVHAQPLADSRPESGPPVSVIATTPEARFTFPNSRPKIWWLRFEASKAPPP